MAFSGREFGGFCTLYVVEHGSQRSFQIRVFSPVPTFHLDPCSMTCFAPTMFLHVYKEFWGVFAVRKDECGKYFAFRTLNSKEWGFFYYQSPKLSSQHRKIE